MPFTPLALLGSLIGCTGQAGPLPDGSWLLEGHVVAGEIGAQDGDISVALWGQNWGTDGKVEASAKVEEDGAVWLAFPVETAAGRATASLELSLDAGQAKLPLGAREGELVHALSVKPGALDEQRRADLSSPWNARRGTLEQAWTTGAFTLRDSSNQLMGSLQLLPGSDALVELLLDHAITDGPMPARRHPEGADVMLHFAVQPRFDEELALLRFNVPSMRAVLPVDRSPHPDDSWFEVIPGPPPPDEIEARRERVERQALADELAMLARLGPQLAAHATDGLQALGRCPQAGELDPRWTVLLGDYTAEVEESRGECRVRLEPSLLQHTRRTATLATPQGLQATEVLGSD